MGCSPNRSRMVIQFNVSTSSKCSVRSMPQLISLKKSTDCALTKISTDSWEHVVDYLNYSEVRELGKTNQFFNSMGKHHKILIKFFKRKNTIIESWKEVIQRISTFRNSKTYSYCTTSSE